MAVIAANVDCPAHEVLTVGSSPNDEVTHDAKGNITFLPTNLLTPARTLFWDFDNQLTGVDTTGDSTPDVTYQYDALHRRVARVQGSADAVYVHAGNQVIAEYRLGGLPSVPQQRYVWGDYIDEPILKQSSGVGGSTLYYHHNQQYSTVALTNSSGEVVERYAYTAYGELLITDHAGTPRASTAHGNRYLYTGREWDDAVKLYYFRARWYEPVLGRFVGRDPISYIEGSSLYRNLFIATGTDPTGTQRLIQCECVVRNLLIDVVETYWVETSCIALKATTCCKRSCEYGSFTGNWKVSAAADEHVDRNDLISRLCADTTKCCSDDCRTTLRKLLDAAKTVPVRAPPDQCAKWVDDFRATYKDDSDCFVLHQVTWEYEPYKTYFPSDLRLRHTAVRVTLCNGRRFYVDNGWWGGLDLNDWWGERGGTFMERPLHSWDWPFVDNEPTHISRL